jgi:hypothetical protein
MQKISSKYAVDNIDESSFEKLIIHKSPEGKPGVIYGPYIPLEMKESDDESRKRYNQFMTEYRKQHRVCPKCGSRDYNMTLVGYIFDERHPEEYKDRNACRCNNCGWGGIVHDLVPEKETVE